MSPLLYRLVVVLVCTSLLLGLMPARAVHAESEPICGDLEVVFIIDQSGSMSGSPIDHPIPNDPNGLRFFAPLHVVRWMGSDYVNANSVRLPSRPVKVYHVAVVDFGDRADVRLPWTTIAPANKEDQEALESALTLKLAPFEGNLGNTNVLAGFEAARDLFAQRSTVRDNCPRRAVFLITDGMPYVKPAEEGGYFSIVQHMAAVKTLVQGELADMGVQTWVTAINDSTDNYWPRMEPYWKDILSIFPEGEEPLAWKVNTEDETSERTSRLMNELADRVYEVVQIGTRCVPPYLQEIMLTFYKRNLSEHLDVSDAIGPLTPSRSDVQVEVSGYDEPIETLRVQQPLPGQWEINTTAPRADVLIQLDKLPANGLLFEPVGRDAIQYVQDTVKLRIADAQGNPLPEYTDPIFGLAVVGEMRFGSGVSTLSFADAGQRQFLASIIPTEAGPHQVTVTARSSTPRQEAPEPAGSLCQWNQTAVLDNIVAGEFDVAPVRMNTAQSGGTIISETEGCPVQVGDQAMLGYQMARIDTGQPVTISLPVEWETRQQTPSTGRKLSVVGPDAATGIYSTTAILDEPGEHQIVALASVRLPDGSLRELLRDTQTIDVAPVQPVQAQLAVLRPANAPWWWRLLERLGLTPADPQTVIGRDPFWHLQPTEIEVLVTLDGHSPADPAAALNVASDQRPVQLVLANADGTAPQAIDLIATNAPGRYHATLPLLPLGPYELRLEPVSGLTAACGFTLPGVVQTRLERVENPLIYAEFLIFAAILLGIILALLRWHCSRRNPCKGYLTLVDKDGKVIGNWYKDLSGRNHWRLKGDQSPPVQCRIRILEVRSTEGSCGRTPYANDMIWVQFTPISMDAEKPVPQFKTLSPREIWKPNQLPGCAIKYVLEHKQLHSTNP